MILISKVTHVLFLFLKKQTQNCRQIHCVQRFACFYRSGENLLSLIRNISKKFVPRGTSIAESSATWAKRCLRLYNVDVTTTKVYCYVCDLNRSVAILLYLIPTV